MHQLLQPPLLSYYWDFTVWHWLQNKCFRRISRKTCSEVKLSPVLLRSKMQENTFKWTHCVQYIGLLKVIFTSDCIRCRHTVICWPGEQLSLKDMLIQSQHILIKTLQMWDDDTGTVRLKIAVSQLESIFGLFRHIEMAKQSWLGKPLYLV